MKSAIVSATATVILTTGALVPMINDYALPGWMCQFVPMLCRGR